MKSSYTAWLFWLITIGPMFVFLMIISTLTIIAVITRWRRMANALVNLIGSTGEWYRERIPTEAA